MCRFALLALVATVAGLAYIANADAAIVVQRSIAGVHLGDTYAEVKAALGPPRKDTKDPDDIRGSVRHLHYGLTDVYMNTGPRGTVTDVTTTSRRQRTARNVGVGSSVATVRRRVAGVHCSRFGSYRFCEVGTARPGHTVTTFVLSTAGRVKRVSLGLVID